MYELITPIRRRLRDASLSRWLPLLALGFLVLAGCAGDDATSAGAPSTHATSATAAPDPAREDEATITTRTIEHVAGTTDVPLDPQRVFTDSVVVAGHLASVGLLPVAASDETREWLSVYAEADLLEGLDPTGIDELGEFDEIDLEALAEVGPDLIVIEEFSSERYDTYSQIAPTIVISRPNNAAWQDAFDQAVAAVGRDDEAGVVRARYQDVLAAAPSTDAVVTFLRGSGPGQFRIDALGGFGGSVAEEADYVVDVGGVDEEEAREGQITFSNEQLGVVSGDLLVTTTQAEGGPSNIDELRDSPFWDEIPAVRTDRIVELPQSIYNGGTYVAAQLLLEAIADEVAN